MYDLNATQDIVPQETLVFTDAMCVAFVGEVVPIIEIVLSDEPRITKPGPRREIRNKRCLALLAVSRLKNHFMLAQVSVLRSAHVLGCFRAFHRVVGVTTVMIRRMGSTWWNAENTLFIVRRPGGQG